MKRGPYSPGLITWAAHWQRHIAYDVISTTVNVCTKDYESGESVIKLYLET